MKQQKLPPGYGVVYLDGEWYPIKIEKFYPIEFITLDRIFDDNINDAHFSRRQDAVEACQRHAYEKGQHEQEQWLRQAVRSRVYPDRSVHYLDEIEALTGNEPCITYDYESPPYCQSVVVYVYASWCPHCQRKQNSGLHFYGLTIEEALEQAVQEVYALRCRCQHIVEEHTQAVA